VPASLESLLSYNSTLHILLYLVVIRLDERCSEAHEPQMIGSVPVVSGLRRCLELMVSSTAPLNRVRQRSTQPVGGEVSRLIAFLERGARLKCDVCWAQAEGTLEGLVGRRSLLDHPNMPAFQYFQAVQACCRLLPTLRTSVQASHAQTVYASNEMALFRVE
jgi:hypothetical protein